MPSICIDPANRCGCAPVASAPCTPCPIPLRDLTYTDVLNGIATSGALVYQGVVIGQHRWQSACTRDSIGVNDVKYILTCDLATHVTEMSKIFWFISGAPCSVLNTTLAMTITDFTCTPLHLHSFVAINEDIYYDE